MMSFMAAGSPDLWGDVGTGVRTPLSILQEQAEALGRKTNNKLTAKVSTWIDDNKFVHAFRLVAPFLKNYTYELFRIRHDAELYPVFTDDTEIDKFFSHGAEELRRPLRLDTEQMFVAWLEKELRSERTRNVVATLLQQVAS